MNLHLETKTAFVSGSTQGIGYAIARQLLAEGAKVIINGRTKEKVDRSVIQLKQEVLNADVSGIAADFSVKEEINHLIDNLPNVDILVDNVGVFELKDFFEIEDERWDRFFEVNVMSGVRLSKVLLPKMLSSNWGRIIFISSESAINIPANMIHHGTTKSSMLALANGLSKLTKGTEVTVNTILGGPTYSDGVAATVEQIAEAQNLNVDQMKQAIVQQTNPDSLLQRFIDPSEISSFAC